MPLNNIEFVKMAMGYFIQIKKASTRYTGQLNLSMASIQTRVHILRIVDPAADTLYAKIKIMHESDITPQVRFAMMNRIIQVYQDIYAELDGENWEGDFDYTDMRDAFLESIDVGFLITDAQNQLGMMRDNYLDHVRQFNEDNETVDDDDMDEPDTGAYDGLIDCISKQSRLMELSTNANNNNREDTIDEIIIVVNRLHLDLTIAVTQLTRHFDVRLPPFYSICTFRADLVEEEVEEDIDLVSDNEDIDLENAD